mmetsp:Transcript_26090/g.40702  ORF Transcript_26090/g.40702 Transcript_26090/m.40702 type:complete len:225 (-) Transcript_26090:21-695(-)
MCGKIPLTYHPKPTIRLGQTTVPRFSGGYMHQFVHIYALHREMEKTTNSWFRAMELWHIARDEGVPYSSFNYAHILRFCTRDKQWEQSLTILSQMDDEGITLDTDCAQQILTACVRCERWDVALQFFEKVQSRGVRLNELSLLSVMMALRRKARYNQSLADHSSRLAIELLSNAKIDNLSNRLRTEVSGFLTELPDGCSHKDALLSLVPRQNMTEERTRFLDSE